MNRSKIDWTDFTWNPISGCRNNCPYCYARKMSTRFSGNIKLNLRSGQYEKEGDNYILEGKFIAETGGTLAYPFGFEPTFHKYRLGEMGGVPGIRKSGYRIFVGAMADIFGDWIPDGWIQQIFEVCEKYSNHNYLFLTKNPERYYQFRKYQADNIWFGASATTANTAHCAADILGFIHGNTFLSLEPLHEDVAGNVDFNCAKWVIVGAETGNRKEIIIPKQEWIENIVEQCDKLNIPVFMKDSLKSIVGENSMRRDFPKELTERKMSEKVKTRIEGDCCKCKAHMRKNKMTTLLARAKRGEQPKQLGFMCDDCFKSFSIEMEFDMTKVINLKEEK